MKLHVSAHDSHHQAYKYCTINMKNVQLLAGLYIEISMYSPANSCTFFILIYHICNPDDGSHEPKHVASCSPLCLINNSILYLLCVIDDYLY